MFSGSRSATAQAEYDLQSILGAKEIAQGELATSLGLTASAPIAVQPLDQLSILESIGETVEGAIQRALAERPDLQAKAAAIREAGAREKELRAAYYPTLSATAYTDAQSLFLHQQDLAWGHTIDLTGGIELGLKMDCVFDGGNRKNRLSGSFCGSTRRAQAELRAGRDDIENQVWEAQAYSLLQTAFRLAGGRCILTHSRIAIVCRLRLNHTTTGVRSLLDVTAAQKVLSQARSSEGIGAYRRSSCTFQFGISYSRHPFGPTNRTRP